MLATILVIATAILTIIYCIWQEKRPRHSLTPSLIPTTWLLMLAMLVLILATVHLANLFGLHTGRQSQLSNAAEALRITSKAAVLGLITSK